MARAATPTRSTISTDVFHRSSSNILLVTLEGARLLVLDHRSQPIFEISQSSVLFRSEKDGWGQCLMRTAHMFFLKATPKVFLYEAYLSS
eukprot:scaffold9629_cov136-Cylindrotheca_fusiformis.AAC.1